MTGLRERRGSSAPLSRPCPLCGGTAARLHKGADSARPGVPSGEAAAAGAPRPVSCCACGLVFIDPLPASALAPEAYGPDYYEPWQGREERARVALWKRRLRMIRERAPIGPLIDVGCGDGLFLKVASDAGYPAEGIEFSPEGARRAALRLGRPVAVGDLARGAILNGPFDIATVWHVLEHLPDPGAMLAAVRRRLRPGGLLIVAVPNLDNRPMQIAYRLIRRRPLPLFEEGGREPHLTHFDPRTLTAILQSRGFVSIEIIADRCALTVAKRGIDAVAALLSRLHGGLLTDAMMAIARRPS